MNTAMKMTKAVLWGTLTLLLAFAPVKYATAQTCVQPPPGLVSWWPGDGNARDIQEANDGTSENGATFTEGKVDQAFSFDGVNDFVRVPSSANLNPGTGNFTVDFWMRTTSSGILRAILNKRPICAHASFWNIRLFSDGHLVISLDQNAAGTNYNLFRSTIPVNDGNWYHIALVRQGTAATLYINGALDYSQSTPGVTNIANNADLLFGNGPCVGRDGTQFYVDELDEIEYYNRALSQAEIQAIFNAGSAGKCRPECTPPPPGLVSWWPGDSNASDIQDGNDGVLTNGALAGVTGQVDGAFRFDGVNQYVSVADALNLNPTTQITLDAWINPTALDGIRPIIAKWDDLSGNLRTYFLSIEDGILRFDISSNGIFFPGTPQSDNVFGSTTVQVGVWQHVAAVYDGTTMTVFLNGNVDASKPASVTSIFTNTRPFLIGAGDIGGGSRKFFDGSIDEVEIYNRALSAEEIQAIFNAGSAGKCRPVAGFGPDHFECYKAWTAKGTPRFEPLEVTLDGQSGSKTVTVLKPVSICIPVDKNGEGIINPDAYLVCYRFKIKDAEEEAEPIKSDVLIQNQFGEQTLTVLRPHFIRHRFLRSYFLRHQTLCVPSTKEDLGVVGDDDD